MNIKEYIESGILEAYVIDALSPEDRIEVQENIARYPELAAEVKAIEEGMLAFARADSKEPPEPLKEQIWNAIKVKDDLNQNSHEIPTKNETIPLTASHGKRYVWQVAAMWVALIGSLLLNFMLWSQKEDREQELIVLNERIDSFSVERHRYNRLVENARQENELRADSAIKAVSMTGVAPGEPMAATMYWSKNNGELYLTIQKMPAPPAGKQYQMWAIRDGAPVSLGVIPNEALANGMITKLPVQVISAEAFAISLEKEGGNLTPTEVQVLGKPS